MNRTKTTSTKTETRTSRVDLPEGHDWKDVARGWVRGNDYAWDCPNCLQQLIGVMDTDGSLELLDLDDLEPCSH